MPLAVPFKVKALYEYDKEQDDDLPFQPNEIITVAEICDDQWYFGHYELNGSKIEGMFPKSYVEDYSSPALAPQEMKPELPTVPQPKTHVSPVEDDWGSDASEIDVESPVAKLPTSTSAPERNHKMFETENKLSKSLEEPDFPHKEPSHSKVPGPAIDIAKDIEDLKVEPKHEEPVEENLNSTLESPNKFEGPPQDEPVKTQTTPETTPSVSPGESLSSNFKSRRGIFNQTESESDAKPFVKPKPAPQKLQKWQPPQQDTPSRSAQTDAPVAPRMSIKERLAMIQQQEQDMKLREENGRKRREQEDEALRIEEERKIRESAEQEGKCSGFQAPDVAEDEQEAPLESQRKPPSIPVLPRVKPEEIPVAGSFDDDEEGARKIALRERMARISGIGNAAGISLGMMLGRNPGNAHSGGAGSSRTKKKDVSAMSDLERELYLASVEYDEAHGDAEAADANADADIESETHNNGIATDTGNIYEDGDTEAQDIADDETLIGTRDTDAETLAESDGEAPRQSSVPSENFTQPASVPIRAPQPPSRSVSSQTPAPGSSNVASAPPVPTTLKPHPKPEITPQEDEFSSPKPAAEPEESMNLHPTDTTGLVADESCLEEFSDTGSSINHEQPSSPSFARTNRLDAIKQHDLHLRNQSDSETGYEADEDTDNPVSKEERSKSAHITSPSTSETSKCYSEGPSAQKLPETRTAPPVPVSAPRIPPAPHTVTEKLSPTSHPTPSLPPAPVARQDEVAPSIPATVSAPPPPPPVPTMAPLESTRSPPILPAPSAPSAPSIPQAPRSIPVPPIQPPVSSQSPRSIQTSMEPAPPVPAPAVSPYPMSTTAPTVPHTAPTPGKSAPPVPTIPPTQGSHYNKGQPQEIDLSLDTLWFTRGDGLPPSVDPTKVLAEIERNESNKRGRIVISHDAFILYSDLSQVHITVSYEKTDPHQAHGSQKYIPPPKVEAATLSHFAKTVGQSIAASIANRQRDTQHTSAFVKSIFNDVPEALPPIKGSFGFPIYENYSGASVHQVGMICPGDIAVLVEANFSTSKHSLASSLQRSSRTVGNAVYIVQEWDGSKKKLRVFDTKKESFRLEDLKSGMIKIYRPVSREFVGW